MLAISISLNTGILDKLLPGDVVLADRGVRYQRFSWGNAGKASYSGLTKRKSQLSAMEVTETRTIANVRIHVECVVGNVRQKCSMLQSTVPY